jgi:flagellar export protein FliJ
MARRFTFSLETLLRVRDLRAREAQRRLAEQRAAIAQLDAQNAQTTREIAAAQAALLGQQRGAALDPTGLARGRAWVAHLRGVIVQREQRKRELERRAEALQDQWLTARRALRIIEKLRERRFTAWRKAEQHREQAEHDEVARTLHTWNAGPAALTARGPQDE